MARLSLKNRTYTDIQVTAPFAGRLPLPAEHQDRAFVIVSFYFPAMRETYGRSVKLTGSAVSTRCDAPVRLDPAGHARVLLGRAILVPPNAAVELLVKGTDGEPVAVVIRGLVPRDVA